ncbi:MAG: glycoside hydrolase family 2 [Bacilli bacterium]|nr:glycoside hydrolase family 2 [Bacilli bacterium]
MKSIFTDSLNLDCPFEGHPNPYFERSNYLLLNGKWDFEVNHDASLDCNYNSSIVVPFAPETPLSGCERRIKPDELMHYRKQFDVPQHFIGKCGILHFSAIDQECEVFLNGKSVGSHQGGYDSFSIYLDSLTKHNVLELIVRDDTNSDIYPRGKQMIKNGGIWYTPTSGIWGEVFLELLDDENYIKNFNLRADYDSRNVYIDVETAGDSSAIVEIFLDGTRIAQKSIKNSGTIDLSENFVSWSPECPKLYEITIKYRLDIVKSIFGFKKFEKRNIGKTSFLFLNDKPIFLSALLDQGYWPDGGLTAPGQKAIDFDIDTIKKAGFNCLRKHIKIESMRWYYACDKKGVLVMQDIMNSGSKYSWWLIHLRPFINFDVNDIDNKILGRGRKESRDRFELDMMRNLEQLRLPTCICIWTLFNEGWGQFRTMEIYQKMKTASGEKLIDATSGWYDRGIGDFNSRHIYFRSPKMKNDNNRVLSLSEFGGYSLSVPGHIYSQKKSFGYAKYSDNKSLNNALIKAYKTDLVREITQNSLCISVYTQLSDVEEEINGLLTYDRAIFKPDLDLVKSLNKALYEAYCKTVEEKSK